MGKLYCPLETVPGRNNKKCCWKVMINVNSVIFHFLFFYNEIFYFMHFIRCYPMNCLLERGVIGYKNEFLLFVLIGK